MRKLIVLTAVLCISSFGCVPLLVGGAIYGVQKGKANTTDRLKAYDDYKIEMSKLNTEREAKGLQPVPIETFDEWNNITATNPIKKHQEGTKDDK